MKKTTIIVIVAVILAASIVAQSLINSQCEELFESPDKVKETAREGLADFLSNPDESELQKQDVEDLVEFHKDVKHESSSDWKVWWCKRKYSERSDSLEKIVKKITSKKKSVIQSDQTPPSRSQCRTDQCQISDSQRVSERCIEKDECHGFFRCDYNGALNRDCECVRRACNTPNKPADCERIISQFCETSQAISGTSSISSS